MGATGRGGSGSGCVVEWQRIRVRPELRERFLKQDEEIWTAGLAREPGFLGKEIWLGEEGEIVLVIRWESDEAWKGVPLERLDELDRLFRAEIPEGYELLEVRSWRAVGSGPA
jgi:uncharacterized protein (TIGR03792 family)